MQFDLFRNGGRQFLIYYLDYEGVWIVKIMDIIKEIWAYRQMIVSLVKRDLKGRYKGSVLGFLWTFLNPLFQLLVYTIVFSRIMRAGIEDYYLFLFVALIPWLFFSTCVSGGAGCIWTQKDMVNKIYFPREVMPISYVISQLINMLLSFLVIFSVLIVTGKGIDITAVAYLPLIIAIEFLFSLGFTFLTASLTVYLRDLEYILGIMIMAWQYMSPVLYDINMVPGEYKAIFMLNPMSPILEAYRDILYYQKIPQVSTLAYALGLGVGVLILGFSIFEKLKRRFSEVL